MAIRTRGNVLRRRSEPSARPPPRVWVAPYLARDSSERLWKDKVGAMTRTFSKVRMRVRGTDVIKNFFGAHSAVRNARYEFIRVSLLVLFALDLTMGQAQVDRTAEYKFKAAYLYNFLQFVDWPQ